VVMRLWETYENHDCGFVVFSRCFEPCRLQTSVTFDVVLRK
jgi:hypothetical protein